MKTENIKSMESLNLICHFTGIFSTFIGIVIAFISLLSSDMRYVQIGIYIFFTGYGMVKTGKKLSDIILSERRP
ncbi:MAG: hypothetical protein KAJ18_04765 [Candidatus Omnitrophica bacterium]|nr:hypothetical protein [Candidatus Omnitrophota bacterium]